MALIVTSSMLATGPDESMETVVEVVTGVAGAVTSTVIAEAGASISSSYW